MHLDNNMLKVFVTGGNAGIGFALCRQLVVDHNCHVFLGSRNAERGAEAVKALIDAADGRGGSVELVSIDVGDDRSVQRGQGLFSLEGINITNSATPSLGIADRAG